MLSSQTIPAMGQDEIQARATRLTAQFPTLAAAPGFGARLSRAQLIATRGQATIIETAPGIFQVQSEHNPLGKYTVDTKAHTCTCPDAGTGRACKHRLAVALYFGWPGEFPASRDSDPITKGLYGSIHHHSLLASRYQWLVRIVAIDGPANLVTIQVCTRDSAGDRYQIFKSPGGDPTSILTTDTDTLKTYFHFTPCTDQDPIE